MHVNVCVFSRYSMKVVKATAQVLNTLWQYRDLRTIYKKVRTLGLMAAAYDYNSITFLDFDKMKAMSFKHQRVRTL